MLNFKQKREHFAISIRRDARNSKFRTLRTQYFQVIPEKYPLESLIRHFDLETRLEFASTGALDDPFIAIKILLVKRQNLIRVSFKNSVSSEIIDEKLCPPEDSEFEIEEVPLPKQYPFQLQTALFQMIIEDMEDKRQGNYSKYKHLEKELQLKMVDFFLDYLRRNKYTETARERDLHIMLLNLLDSFLSYYDSEDLKQLILRWVSGTDALGLISRCISPSDSLTYQKNQKIYQLILRGLKHAKMDVRFNAISLLETIIRRHDYDDILKIQEQIPEIYKEVIRYFEIMDRHDSAQFFEQNHMALQSVQEAAQCVIYFLGCYDEEIVKCMEEGAGYVGVSLIMQQQEELIEQGLIILNCIADAHDEMFVKRAVEFLLKNPSIKQTKVWQCLGRSYEIVCHRSLEIRRMFVAFVTRVIANTQLDLILQMNHLFLYPNGQTLVDILVLLFIHNDDLTIREWILQCFQGICFYADTIDEEILIQEDEQRKECYRTLSIEVVIGKIMDSEMKNIMKEIQAKEEQSGFVSLKEHTLGNLISLFFEFIDDRSQRINNNRDQEF